MNSRQFLRAAVLAVLLGALFSPSALAHTELITATPVSESKLESPPTEVRLEFNESLLMIGDESPNSIAVRDEAGNLISGVTEISGPIASVDLSAASGTITVQYRVVSGDGHRVEGEYQFTVTPNEQMNSAPMESIAETGPSALLWVIWILLALSALGIAALLRLRK